MTRRAQLVLGLLAGGALVGATVLQARAVQTGSPVTVATLPQASSGIAAEGRVVAYPGVHFEFDDHVVDATVFPVDGIRQAPVSPVDGKPMRRANAAEVEGLLL